MENNGIQHLNFMRNILTSIILLITPLGFSQTRDVTGCYSSNFAVIGWFGMHLELKPDSTFYYTHKGDLMFDRATGVYLVKGKTIHLTYDIPEYDTLYFKFKDSLNRTDSVPIPQRTCHLMHTRPSKLFYSRKKLLFLSENGQKTKKNTNRKGRLRKYYLAIHEHHDQTEW